MKNMTKEKEKPSDLEEAKAELKKITDQYVAIIKGLSRNFKENIEKEKPECGGIVLPFCETIKEETENTGAMDFDFVLPSTFRPKLTDQEATEKLKKLQEKTKRKMKEIIDNSDMKRADMSISLEKKKK